MKKTYLLPVALSFVLAFSTLAACNQPGEDPTEKKDAFTWTGLTNETIAVGDEFDLLSGVSVKDAEGNDITSSVYVLTYEDNEAELTKLGVYEDYEDFNHNIVGVYNLYYGAKSGEKEEFKAREITVEQQYNVANGDFAETNNDGFYGWKFDHPGGAAEFEKVTENGKAKPKFNVTGCGNAWYSLQYMSQCNLKQGETYKVTVRAKSTNGKSFAFGFEDVANNYAMLQGLTAYKATAEYADYVSYYTADADYNGAKAVLYFGYILDEDPAKTYDITIDSIKIEKIERCPNVTFEGLDKVTFYAGSDELNEFIANPRGGVTASDGETDLTDKIKTVGTLSTSVMENTNFVLAYIVENDNGPTAIAYRTITIWLAKEHEYDLSNGTFDEDIRFWTQDIVADGGGDATYEWTKGDEDEGAAKITILAPADAGWKIQLRQEVTMAANTNYVIKIRAKATVARSISLELNAGSNYSFNVNLKTTYEETVIYYTAPANTTGFRFLLGGGGTECKDSVIYIDYAKIELDEDQTQYEGYQMLNPNFEYGMKNWGSEGANFVAGEDADGKYVQAECGVTDAGWRIQLRQDGRNFEQGKKYKLIIKAKSSVAKQITVEIDPNHKLGLSTTFDLTTEVQTFDYTFTASESTDFASRVGMLLGGNTAATVTVYQFEIVEVTE